MAKGKGAGKAATASPAFTDGEEAAVASPVVASEHHDQDAADWHPPAPTPADLLSAPVEHEAAKHLVDVKIALVQATTCAVLVTYRLTPAEGSELNESGVQAAAHMIADSFREKLSK